MKTNPKQSTLTRRAFLRGTCLATFAIPTLVPSTVFGANAPSNRITIGCIGVGRMGRGDAQDFMRFGNAQIIAVCDVDAKRMADAKQLVERRYATRAPEGSFKGCSEHGDFRDLIARPDIDAVSIVSPDHWHALHAIAAANGGKDIFVQKPMTYSIEEGRALCETVARTGRILQVGSQQRSDTKFRLACELVRNGRIGELKTVKVGFGLDPSGEEEPAMPVPKNLNYDFWLGPAPTAPYTENRVHPQRDYGRPGWLRIQDYCHGMITGWGSHHMDIAQWGMGVEHSGPIRIEAQAEFPKSGLWNVHGAFHIEYTYANGVQVICAGNDENKQGVEFIGTEGWIWVKRGSIEVNPESLLDEGTQGFKTRLYHSRNHKGNFLECIRTRQEPVAPAEIGHRSNTACVVGSLAMRLGRKLRFRKPNGHKSNMRYPN
ncbi:MAG: Gfo/Idh/MocA family oxidoreductase [Verrucomicrobia bacterium]|nr:Gfo/Idh/MocA family oxidoreductase [Verrucomicrobiota bacterium]